MSNALDLVLLGKSCTLETFQTISDSNRGPIGIERDGIVVSIPKDSHILNNYTEFKKTVNNIHNGLSPRFTKIIHQFYSSECQLKFSKNQFIILSKLLRNVKLENLNRELTNKDLELIADIQKTIKYQFEYRGVIFRQDSIDLKSQLKPLNYKCLAQCDSNALLRYIKSLTTYEHILTLVREHSLGYL